MFISKLKQLKNYKIEQGCLFISLFNEEGELAPEIQIRYTNDIILVIFDGGYLIMDDKENVIESNPFEIDEDLYEIDYTEYLNSISYEIVKTLHHLTTQMFGVKTDCKMQTIDTFLKKMKSKYPEEDISFEENLLTYLVIFYQRLDFLGAAIAPYTVKNYD